MAITARALNRSTLARQLLLTREPLDVAAGLRQVVALQAQQPASPYVALWNRLSDFSPADLDAAVSDFQAVKATLMRVTLHLVHAADYRAFREAVEPTLRGSRLGDARFTASGLTAADADALVPELLEFAGRPRTTSDMQKWLGERLGAPLEPSAWRMLRQYVPLWHAPVAAPWLFDTRQAHVAASTRPVLADPDAAAAGLQALVRRYLAGFGPASVADVAQFALVQQRRARAAVQALADELVTLEGPGGVVLYDIPGAPRPDEDAPAPPRLMAMWDSVLLAYADRGRVIPPAYRKHVIRRNGDVLPTVLVDGYVAGVWRPVAGGIEAGAFHPLPRRVWDGLASEARSLGRLLTGRDPGAYRRYDHWWAKGLPAAETRLLPPGP
ncbi:winged helix DNA-binding domain-containing protein [Streptomyces albofaciens JCM 4342]|uniref:winged helix DNA-binding domain-containing protein n=1 Tax=Streptomyces albofaciens TaxID=66866 RepID=UPI00123870C7|nr:winged helix DNA-binding domain-containing protein [Streptomyces albofaciens]KAA6213395.1 winged helix DNA-binding domain-containing protein [Streptomyces albofaciens JCM 4342]